MARQIQSVPYGGATYDALAQRYYEPVIREQLIEDFHEINWLNKEGRINRKPDIRGSEIYFSTTVKRSSGVGARGEMDTLPVIDQVDNVEGHLPFMRGYKGRIGISAETFKYAREG